MQECLRFFLQYFERSAKIPFSKLPFLNKERFPLEEGFLFFNQKSTILPKNCP